MVVRPEMVEIGARFSTASCARQAYLGNVIEYDVEIAGRLLALVEHDPRRMTQHPEGTQVGLRFLEILYVLPDETRQYDGLRVQ